MDSPFRDNSNKNKPANVTRVNAYGKTFEMEQY